MFRIENTTAARRAATATAGVVLIAGAALMVATAFPRVFHIERLAHASYDLVFGTWSAALLAGALTYTIVRLSPTASARPMRPARPFVLLSVGAALMLPLTLHAIAGLVIWSESARDFHQWIALSLMLTPTAHLMFAAIAGARAAQLANGQPAASLKWVYGVTVAVSAVPFGLLYMLPPILVAITGLPILPLLRLMERYAAYDRNAIEVPRAHAPRAPVVA
jgi:hypothetical protein